MNLVAENLLVDGDTAFLRVDNRRPAHALEPGVAASAINKRSENGKMCPRYGVAMDAWGITQPDLLSGKVWSKNTLWPTDTQLYLTVTGFSIGRAYTWTRTDSNIQLATALAFNGITYSPSGTQLSPGEFTATQTTYYMGLITSDDPIPDIEDTIEATVPPATCAYARFSDPLTNTDNAVLVTDDWRDISGEDGGRGRAFRILSGNTPQEISLNGHDVWDTARMVQCNNAMLLLRHGNERYYFSASAVNAADYIQLNLTVPWGVGTGRRVRYDLAVPSSAIYGPVPPLAGNYYYAKHIALDRVEFYTDAALTNKLDFATAGVDAPVGKFYIEEAQDPVPFFGNGARNLVMQPNEDGNTAFEAGFISMVENVEITDTNATTDIITAPNHRFQPGDIVTGTAISGVFWDRYAAPQSPHTLKLYTSADDAQVDDGVTGLVNLTANGETGSIWKSSAAGVPLPPCREGAYVNGRFIGINGRDTVLISDPFDFLHCTIFAATIPANQGEAGAANWIRPMGSSDTVAVGKENNKVIGITNLSQTPDFWTEITITAEYGGIAPLAVVPVGSDLWFASRKGFASVERTIAGQTLGSAITVSHDIPDDLADIDWLNAQLMCAEIWNNRLFWAVPTKGQDTPVNNKVLVYNFLSQTLTVQQQVVAGELTGSVQKVAPGYRLVDGWEGIWTGDLLIPYSFARLTVNGEERLTFATPDGIVLWFHDGWDDNGAEIEDELVTRGYFGGRRVLVLDGSATWETYRPTLTAILRTAGVNEESTLTEDLIYDSTKYLAFDAPAYDPTTATSETFSAPHREDYSPSPEELLVATLDTHQSATQRLFARARDRAPQLVIRNTQGSARICSTTLKAKPLPTVASYQT